MISIRGEKTYEFRGLSTDKKPIDGYIDNGSIFIEMDTSIIYTFDKKNKQWLVLDWNTAASQEEFEEFKEEVEEEIEKIKDYSDVKDVVGTYADLIAYDTSKLNDNDVIEVLMDEENDNANTMYKWHTDSQEFELIGKLGPYYTKAQADARYVNDVRLRIQEPNEGESATVQGDLVAVKYDLETEQEIIVPIVSLDQLRDIINTPSPDTPDVDDVESGEEPYKDEDLVLIVTDQNGEAVKMTLEQLRQRFITATDTDNTNFDDAQIGEFIYEEIIEESGE